MIKCNCISASNARAKGIIHQKFTPISKPTTQNCFRLLMRIQTSQVTVIDSAQNAMHLRGTRGNSRYRQKFLVGSANAKRAQLVRDAKSSRWDIWGLHCMLRQRLSQQTHFLVPSATRQRASLPTRTSKPISSSLSPCLAVVQPASTSSLHQPRHLPGQCSCRHQKMRSREW